MQYSTSFSSSLLTHNPVFNFDNKIDLTDSGMAKAKAMRYNARKERGEIPSKEVVANLDPYRWYDTHHVELLSSVVLKPVPLLW